MIDQSVFSNLRIGMHVCLTFIVHSSGLGSVTRDPFDTYCKAQGIIVQKTWKKRRANQKEALTLNVAEIEEAFLDIAELQGCINWTVRVEDIQHLDILPLVFEELLTCENRELREFATTFLDFKNKQ